MKDAILTINAGSSSIKFSVYGVDSEPRELGRGQVERLGPQARIAVANGGGPAEWQDIGEADHAAALREILARLAPILDGRKITGVGHRIVHGGTEFSSPAELTDDTINQLSDLKKLAPLHQPFNIAGILAAKAAFPKALQIGCFDTAFHRDHPWRFDTFALPRSFYDEGIRRYGFHGLSYDFIAGEFARLHPDLADGRLIVAHLGNGASMCALRDGRSVNSTMGFTALDGLAMGTRPGQIDPGVLLYLMESKGMDAGALTRLLYHESGLQGLSGISHDMRTLLSSPAPEAAQALEYYASRLRHEIGALSADLGGLDALIFTGGIGENSPQVRSMACADMDWLGLALDEGPNQRAEREIGRGRVRVFVIPTDEERVIARAVFAAL